MAKDKKKKGKPKTAAGFKAITQNPLVADVVATALVATAAALRDNRKARQLAEQAGDELTELAREGAEKGNAMWQLALEVGRRALDTIVGEGPSKPAKRVKPAKADKAAKPAKVAKAAKASKVSKAAKKPKRASTRRKPN